MSIDIKALCFSSISRPFNLAKRLTNSPINISEQPIAIAKTDHQQTWYCLKFWRSHNVQQNYKYAPFRQ